MAVIPRLDVERIIRKAGAQRVSMEAGETLTEILEDRAVEIVEKALVIAKYARRKSKKPALTKIDILTAVSLYSS